MISVCMATHNGEKYIKEQVDSILCQLAHDDEIIVSDDGSTDGTLLILQGYKDNRIKIFHFQQPGHAKKASLNVARNFENALKRAKGDYIFLSDQDDKWMKDKVDICSNLLRGNDLVIHNLRLVDSELVDSGKNFYNESNRIRFHNILSIREEYPGCAMAFRREMLHFILPFPYNLVSHDYWIGQLCEFYGRAAYVDTPLIYYRIRKESVSHSANNTFIYKIQYRLRQLRHLSLRIVKINLKMNV